jgi:RNA polymerase sigma-70 factor (ECF subfamily)
MKKPYDQQSEEDLMQSVSCGDMGAFDELVERMQPRLYAFCRRHVRQEAAAEDIVQESLLRLFKHRARYQAGKRVSTWLFTIALNLCRDYFRANGRNSSLSDQAVACAAENSRWRPSFSDPLEQAQKKEMADLLLQALAGLPEQSRKILDLRSSQGLTFEEAALRLGIKPDAARAAASRAYKKLKEMLKKNTNAD